MPALANILAPYNADPTKLAHQYESRPFEQFHAACRDLIPTAPGYVLDVGAGSGRDAAWFAAQGFEVMAVEPAQKLRELAQRMHSDPHIGWTDDHLPDLSEVSSLGRTFDLIWLSAVWMHLPSPNRACTFAKLVSLLEPGGRMMLTIREGPALPDRVMFPTVPNEIQDLAQRFRLNMLLDKTSGDELGRDGVSWRVFVVQI